MKILVLSLTKRLKKTDKTEYLSKYGVLKTDDNSVYVREVGDSSFLLERQLFGAVKDKYDFIVVSAPFRGRGGENAFRSKFAFIIPNAERKIQKAPSAKKKGRRKKGEEIETVTYNRKKTHVFPVELDGKTAYAFSYLGAKVAFISSKADKKQLGDLPERVLETFRANDDDYPDGYSLRERSARVLTFFERHFPIKSDPKGEKIRKSVMLTALCAFLIAAYLFVQNIYLIPMHNNAIISEIQTIFYDGQESGSAKDVNKITEKNWKELKKINKEIVGWVKINNTKIDYPVLWHKADTADDQYYLWRNYKQEYYQGGTTSIFLDWRSKKGMNSKNVILHGHHMEDGSMFADLLKYGAYTGNLKFYKQSPIVKISTPKGGTQTYKIISVFKSNVDENLGEYFDFYCGSFKNDSQFLNYVYNLRIRSLINCPVSVNEKDQLLSLVT
ncbi:MAG: class B sortase, partial [Ruminococcus sp.]|nr:class B sortase [Ruminococcus sp.]